MHWSFLFGGDWSFSSDSKWLISPDANRNTPDPSQIGDVPLALSIFYLFPLHCLAELISRHRLSRLFAKPEHNTALSVRLIFNGPCLPAISALRPDAHRSSRRLDQTCLLHRVPRVIVNSRIIYFASCTPRATAPSLS